MKLKTKMKITAVKTFLKASRTYKNLKATFTKVKQGNYKLLILTNQNLYVLSVGIQSDRVQTVKLVEKSLTGVKED